MIWFLLALLAYALLAVTAIGDKYLLSGPIPDAATYAFYVGVLSGLVVLLVPFLGFPFLPSGPLLLALLAGAILVLGMFVMYWGLHLFEASRIMPAIGGLSPIFVFALSAFFLTRPALSVWDVIGFLALVAGASIITREENEKASFESFVTAAFAAFLFAASFVLSKYVYLAGTFWSGFLWMRLGGVLAALMIALATPHLRGKLFSGKIWHPGHMSPRKGRTALLFLGNQALGASAIVLQNVSLFLVPAAFISIANAIQGSEYVFILLFAVIISLKFPQVIKEYVSKKTLAQKIVAVLLIVIGLTIFAGYHYF